MTTSTPVSRTRKKAEKDIKTAEAGKIGKENKGKYLENLA